MRFTFTYSNTPDLSSLSRYEVMTQHLNLPDEVQHLLSVEERLRAIGKYVGELSRASVHITCKEFGIQDERMNDKSIDSQSEFMMSVLMCTFSNSLVFHGHKTHKRRKQHVVFKILCPIDPPVPQSYLMPSGRLKSKQKKILGNRIIQFGNYWAKSETEKYLADIINNLATQIEMLLNADPNANWQRAGFYPYWYDNQLIKQTNNQRKKLEESKQKQAKSGKIKTSKQHGKGNRIGAIPGEFMGVQMRSQLEIRFAAELEQRDIEWIYELERLGKGNYLVDFYLPELKTWVEVKGKFEARDHFLLKEVAELLISERDERLFVYTSGKPVIVSPDEFTPLSRKEFWQQLTS